MANGLGVAGWVRNLPDGRVEFAAEGTRDYASQLLSWCQQGPPRANVTTVDITDEPLRGDRYFRIVSERPDEG